MSQQTFHQNSRSNNSDNNKDQLLNMYLSQPPPLFSFSKKTQKLNWDILEKVDVDQDIMINKDIALLEQLLGNITMADLSKEDLKMLRDKNLIKLFKLG